MKKINWNKAINVAATTIANNVRAEIKTKGPAKLTVHVGPAKIVVIASAGARRPKSKRN